MRKCSRCHTSMLSDFRDVSEGSERIWRCLGCGRETFDDSSRQDEDDRMRERIKLYEAGSRRRA